MLTVLFLKLDFGTLKILTKNQQQTQQEQLILIGDLFCVIHLP